MAEDSGDDMDDLSGCIGVGLKHLTSIQKKAVKEKVQCIDSEIPICVAVMPRTSVTGSFNLVSSIVYSIIISFDTNILLSFYAYSASDTFHLTFLSSFPHR
jgi:hypothetical protein